MTQLQKIVAKAKSLKKSYPNTKWTDLIKKASKLVTPAKKSVSGIKRTVVKKYAPVKPLVKKRIETKSDFAMAGIKKKKATKKAVKKSPARSLHKDTKSHNVRISVMSGINKITLSKIDWYLKHIASNEKMIEILKNRISNTKEKQFKIDARKTILNLKKVNTDYKKMITSLKKHIK
jgi:hypothetical protein